VPVQGRPAHTRGRGDIGHAGRLTTGGQQVSGHVEDHLGDPVVTSPSHAPKA
jgi:hypothetical protein